MKKERKKGSGRKPLTDRSLVKVQLPIYIKKQTIDSLGGNDKIREKIYTYLETL